MIPRNYAAMGFSGVYPENSAMAYRKAIEVGANAFEVDVNMTKDGVLVMSHDEVVDRLTQGKGFIRDYTFSELCELNNAYQFTNREKVHQLFFSTPREQEIAEAEKILPMRYATLDEFLAIVKESGNHAIVEMKAPNETHPDMGDRIAQMIRDYGLVDRAAISYYDHEAVYGYAKRNPDITFATVITFETLHNPGKYCQEMGTRQLHPYSTIVTPQMVENCHNAGVEIIAWSCGETDTEEHQQHLIDLGVDGLMTHFPNRYANLLKKLGK